MSRLVFEATEHGFVARLPPAPQPALLLVERFAEAHYVIQVGVLFAVLQSASWLAFPPRDPSLSLLIAGLLALASRVAFRWLLDKVEVPTTLTLRHGMLHLSAGGWEAKVPLESPVQAEHLELGTYTVTFGTDPGAIQITTRLRPPEIEHLLAQLDRARRAHGDPGSLPHALRVLRRDPSTNTR